MRDRALVVIFAVSAVASILISCQSPQMAARLRYPQLEVTGSEAKQLSKEDIFEIVDVASNQPKMLNPIHQIDADMPDHAVVHGGGANSEKESILKVHKQNGRWTIIGE